MCVVGVSLQMSWCAVVHPCTQVFYFLLPKDRQRVTKRDLDALQETAAKRPRVDSGPQQQTNAQEAGAAAGASGAAPE